MRVQKHFTSMFYRGWLLMLMGREEMAESCRTRCREWVDNANADMKSWVRDPQPSVFKHTFRDRQPGAEIGPSNGHVSSRKYIPRCSCSSCDFAGGADRND